MRCGCFAWEFPKGFCGAIGGGAKGKICVLLTRIFWRSGTECILGCLEDQGYSTISCVDREAHESFKVSFHVFHYLILHIMRTMGKRENASR